MILVNEIYGPVKQGEGASAGNDVMFLRLAGCNLACIWCDTPYTWNWEGTVFKHPQKFDKKKEVHRMTVVQIINELYTCISGRNFEKALVLSGGEPMLQQNKLIPLLSNLKKEGWWIEVETNGTIVPTTEFIQNIDQFNCSPKTSNSGEDNPPKSRINEVALKTIALSGKGTFKFVIQEEKDIPEIQEIISIGNIIPPQVWLMPEGRTKEEQIENQIKVHQLAKKHSYHFTPRLHVLEFGAKRGV